MKYELKVYKIENYTVINISGKIDSSNSEEAEAELNLMLENNDKYYILDLCGLEYISSAGLRVFLSASKKIKNKNFFSILIYGLHILAYTIFACCQANIKEYNIFI